MRSSINLDASLLQLSPDDAFTLRDACQGVLITGGIGSGKTSGSGAALARAYLLAGMGGIVCCAKPEEAAQWRRYCQQTGRMGSLMEVNGHNGGINILAYELARQGSGGINAVIELLMAVLQICRSVGAAEGKASEQFWEDTVRQVLRHAIPIIYAATGTVRISDLLAFVRSAPHSPEEMRDPAWQQHSLFCRYFAEAAPKIADEVGAKLVGYWQNDWATLDAKTRGGIQISLTTALDRFNHGWLADLFCGETHFTLELTFHGAILLLDMPALTMNEDGIIAQQILKYLWQRAVLARNGLPEFQQARPLFLWADECQYFVNSHDAEFLSTCRGSRACTVYLTQNLPSLYASFGGEKPEHRVNQFVGNFATRIWHNNACAETNEWAAKTMGRAVQERRSYNQSEGSSRNWGMNAGEGENRGSNASSGWNSSHSGNSYSVGSSGSSGTSQGDSTNWGRQRGRASNESVSHGVSEQVDFIIEPGEFGRMLKTGGPANGNVVSAVWFSAGRRFDASRGNALHVEFGQ
ncbi:type IV secretory system conjugative DNA transfer family protein [Novosphingobium naphthalenivorans]|uniref:type IV secretory system conjugative DNA transfer family protein n=1 Tax=Novosphingobium naphthalenivorans TaxID=273168 RepID=UPI00082A2959|nr:TraM recognition domain-containing protein [Novosphingobium naphthalenivorans]